jgi:hypothetical protein
MTPYGWFGSNYTTNNTKIQSRSCDFGGDEVTDEELDVCVYPTLSGIPAGSPTSMYYGFDYYGSQSELSEFDADFGGEYSASNGQMEAFVGMSTDVRTAFPSL